MSSDVRTELSLGDQPGLRGRLADWFVLDGDRRVVTAGIPVVVPLAVFSASILRAAIVAYRTVSVGPFVPPEER